MRSSLLSWIVVCLSAAAMPAQGAFTSYSTRINWSANSTLDGAFVTNSVNWIDFDTTAECGQQGCPVLNGGPKQYNASTLNAAATMTLQGFAGVSLYALGTTGSNTYWLQNISDTNNNYNYNVPFATARPQNGTTGTIRINLPVGTTAFAVELATGCNGSLAAACSGLANSSIAGSISINTSAGALPGTVTTSSTNGTLTFTGFTSDTAFTWVEFSAGTGTTVVLSRFSYGLASALEEPPPSGGDTPEAATFLLVGGALVALGYYRRRNVVAAAAAVA